MTDLISKETAYNNLVAFYGLTTSAQKKTLKEALNTVPTVERQDWIPCKVRQPTDSVDKLVTFESGEVGTAYFVKKETIFGGRFGLPIAQRENFWYINEEDDEEGEVVAWMEMPDGYKEEKQNDM